MKIKHLQDAGKTNVGQSEPSAARGFVGHTHDGTLNGQLYFLTDGEAIKVGWSGNPKERIKSLQTAHPRPLRTIATTPGSTGDEHAIHALFSELRLKGEWFRSTPEILKFIDDYCLEGGQVSAIRAETAQAVASITAWGRKSPAYDGLCATIALGLRVLFKNPNDVETRKKIFASLKEIEARLAAAREPIKTRRLSPVALAALEAAVSPFPVNGHEPKKINGLSVSGSVG